MGRNIMSSAQEVKHIRLPRLEIDAKMAQEYLIRLIRYNLMDFLRLGESSWREHTHPLSFKGFREELLAELMEKLRERLEPVGIKRLNRVPIALFSREGLRMAVAGCLTGSETVLVSVLAVREGEKVNDVIAMLEETGAAGAGEGIYRGPLNIEDLLKLDPYQFEDLVLELFRSLGYRAEVTKRTSDGGIDIIAHHKPPGLSTELKIVIQCKRWKPDRKIGAREVRELADVVIREGASIGILITTSGYTKQALEERNAYEQRGILMELWDQDKILKALALKP